jgi:hypothetical protein
MKHHLWFFDARAHGLKAQGRLLSVKDRFFAAD